MASPSVRESNAAGIQTNGCLAYTFDITSTAAAIVTTGTVGRRRTMLIQNLSGSDIYIGHSAVATTTGYKIANGISLTYTLEPTQNIYAITATTATIRVLEVYND